MRGQDKRDGVAQTLEEVAEYKRKRDGDREAAKVMRSEAKRLMERADALDGGETCEGGC